MKNANNWKLIALLAGLVLIFFAVRIFRSPTLESNLPENLTDIDTTKVTELVVTPAKDRSAEIRLVKTANTWELRKGDQVAHLEMGGGVTALRSIMNLKPQRIMSKKKEKWNDFSVGDSTGTRVKVMAGNSVKADLWIGRIGFTQNAGGNFSQGAFTHVRLNGDNDVFAVEGFLDGQFNRVFNDWRDQRFIRIKRDSIDKITFRYPADSSFVLERRNGKWMLGPDPADSAAVSSYLAGLEYKNLNSFNDHVPTGGAVAEISFENHTKVVVKVEGWPQAGPWTFRSSEQPDTFFSSEGSSVMKDVWRGFKTFRKSNVK